MWFLHGKSWIPHLLRSWGAANTGVGRHKDWTSVMPVAMCSQEISAPPQDCRWGGAKSSKCGKAVTSLLTGSETAHHTHLFLGLAHVLRPVPKLTEITGTLSTDNNELQIRPIKSCSKTAAIWDYFWVTVVRDITKICWLVLVGKHNSLGRLSKRSDSKRSGSQILILRGGCLGGRPWRGQCGQASIATACFLPVLGTHRALHIWLPES